MSASREKKARQQLHASGYVDPKAIKAEEDRKATKRANTLYAILGVAFVLVAVVLLFSAGIVSYYYQSISANLTEKAMAAAEPEQNLRK